MLNVNDLLGYVERGLKIFSDVRDTFARGDVVLRSNTGLRPFTDTGNGPNLGGASGVPDSPYIPDFIENALYGSDPKNCNLGMVTHVPEYQYRIKCKKGYVAVRCRGADGQQAEMCMYKPVARALGLWKARAKPPISVKDYKAIQRSSSAVKRITAVAKKAGALPKPRRRSSSGK